MQHWMRNCRTLLTPVAVLILSSCASTAGNGWVSLDPPQPAGSGPTFQIAGTVHHLDLEGGLFVIRDAQGEQYSPLYLPDAFRVDGMTVEAEARRRDDMASIGMVGPLVELLRIRSRPGGSPVATTLVGTKWRLEDLAGAGVIDRVQATLEFTEEGKVSGNGTCNRFSGTVTLNGDVIAFGPLATTRMMCPEAIMNQETAYLAALHDARRIELKEPFLYVFASDPQKPLRFIRAEE